MKKLLTLTRSDGRKEILDFAEVPETESSLRDNPPPTASPQQETPVRKSSYGDEINQSFQY